MRDANVIIFGAVDTEPQCFVEVDQMALCRQDNLAPWMGVLALPQSFLHKGSGHSSSAAVFFHQHTPDVHLWSVVQRGEDAQIGVGWSCVLGLCGFLWGLHPSEQVMGLPIVLVDFRVGALLLDDKHIDSGLQGLQQQPLRKVPKLFPKPGQGFCPS